METRITRINRGIFAGLTAGVVFGFLAGLAGTLPEIAAMVGATSTTIGFIVSLVVSALVGALYPLLFGTVSHSPGRGLGYGLLYGVIWWILGPLIIMPLLLGTALLPIFSIEAFYIAWPSLLMHLVFGAILGTVYASLSRNVPDEATASETRKREHHEYRYNQ